MTTAERLAMYRANCQTCLLSDRMKPCKLGEFCLFEQPEVREPVQALTASAYMEAPDPEPWHIGNNMIFGSAAWFETIEEFPY